MAHLLAICLSFSTSRALTFLPVVWDVKPTKKHKSMASCEGFEEIAMNADRKFIHMNDFVYPLADDTPLLAGTALAAVEQAAADEKQSTGTP